MATLRPIFIPLILMLLPTAVLALPVGFVVRTVTELPKTAVTLTDKVEYRVTGTGDFTKGEPIHLNSPDAWIAFERLAPSQAAGVLGRVWVGNEQAALNKNIRVVQYGPGSVIIPQGPDYAAMTVFDRPRLAGQSLPLKCYEKYDSSTLGNMVSAIHSFQLKRGYMATIAQNDNGTGVSRNYVAQDSDIEVATLPPALDGSVHFIRIFPWRWVSKKGVAGDIYKNLNVGWYYDWNISHNSTPDLEYVPIRQKRAWPPLKQDWSARGATELLGYNEPDHKDQSNLNVADALASWPDLMGTGLRLGSPAVSDGGLKWLYDFTDKADAQNLRVDFVAVHYYRAFAGNASDARGATDQFYRFLKGIHDKTHRPIWITEFNNGANWTGHKPTYEQEKAVIAGFVEMLDNTPFVERYAIYNWVEDERNVQRKDGSLTGAGEVYRDKLSPMSYTQSAE